MIGGRLRLGMVVRLVLVAGLFAASACGDDEADAGSQIESDPQLVDDSGTVTEWKFTDDVSEGPESGEDYGIVAAPTGWDLRVVWPSEPCLASPIVKTEGDEGMSTIVIDPGPRWAGDDEPGLHSCPQVQVGHGFDFKISKPPADDITVRFKGKS